MIYKIAIFGLTICGWVLFAGCLYALFVDSYIESIAHGVASIASFIIMKIGEEEYDKKHG